MLLRALKAAAELAALLLLLAAIGVWSLLFADFDPPLHEPPCKKGSIVALLDPCEVRP